MSAFASQRAGAATIGRICLSLGFALMSPSCRSGSAEAAPDCSIVRRHSSDDAKSVRLHMVRTGGDVAAFAAAAAVPQERSGAFSHLKAVVGMERASALLGGCFVVASHSGTVELPGRCIGWRFFGEDSGFIGSTNVESDDETVVCLYPKAIAVVLAEDSAGVRIPGVPVVLEENFGKIGVDICQGVTDSHGVVRLEFPWRDEFRRLSVRCALIPSIHNELDLRNVTDPIESVLVLTEYGVLRLADGDPKHGMGLVRIVPIIFDSFECGHRWGESFILAGPSGNQEASVVIGNNMRYFVEWW